MDTDTDTYRSQMNLRWGGRWWSLDASVRGRGRLRVCVTRLLHLLKNDGAAPQQHPHSHARMSCDVTDPFLRTIADCLHRQQMQQVQIYHPQQSQVHSFSVDVDVLLQVLRQENIDNRVVKK